MSSKTYVVTKDRDGMGRYTNVYVGDDPDKAKEACDAQYEELGGKKYHTFIEVWEDGVHLYSTRAHPSDL